jgi:hypothetical protein
VEIESEENKFFKQGEHPVPFEPFISIRRMVLTKYWFCQGKTFELN